MEKKISKFFPIYFSRKKGKFSRKKNTAMDGWTFDANFCLDICKIITSELTAKACPMKMDGWLMWGNVFFVNFLI